MLMMVATLALLGLGAHPAVAQEWESQPKRESKDVHLRNDCRLAVQVLTHGHPAAPTRQALPARMNHPATRADDLRLALQHALQVLFLRSLDNLYRHLPRQSPPELG